MSIENPLPVGILLSGAGLSDRDWRKILLYIHDGKVIPVIGPELVTLPDPETGEIVPLKRFLAPCLAAVLGLADDDRFTTVNAVACGHPLNGGSRANIYDELREILDHLDGPPRRVFTRPVPIETRLMRSLPSGHLRRYSGRVAMV